MNANYRFPVLLPLAALAFAAAHLAFEYFTGGVQSHNLLNRPDLPAISNWLELITLPLLGIASGFRVRRQSSSAAWAGISFTIFAGFLGALLYGVVLATSFELEASTITSVAFFGLFFCALLFPVYRAEYILGFVAGMTFTFGGILPLIVASVLAVVSLVARCSIRAVAAVLHKIRAPCQDARRDDTSV